MNAFPMRLAGGLVAGTLLLSQQAPAQSQWTDLGCALPGAAGDAELTGSGPLTPGSANTVSLGNANDDALSLLFLGLEQGSIAFKGGVLKPLPLFDLPLTQTSGAGTQDLPFTWPTGLPDGLPFYLQYAIQDRGAANGVALSNALRGVSAGSVPVIDDIAPLFVTEGGELTIQGVNLSTDPRDVLTQLVLPGGALVGYASTQTSDGNTVTTQVQHVLNGTSVARVAVGNGEGELYVPSAVPPFVSLDEGGARMWRGLPEDIEVSEQFVAIGSGDPGLPPGCTEYPGTVTSLDWLEIPFPALVCEPGTTVHVFLYVYSTSSLYCNSFGATMTNTGSGSAEDCAIVIGSLIEDSFDDTWGLDINWTVSTSGVDSLLRIGPPSGEEWNLGSSQTMLVVCQPQTPGCETVSGGIDSGSGYVIVELPSSIPDDATVTWSFEGTVDGSGASYNLSNTLNLSGPLQPIDVANAVEVDLQAALTGAGALASAVAFPLGGGGAQLQVWPPFFDFWASGQLVLEICE